MKKVGRNEPCPCGSGKKHKHCCGAKAGPNTRVLLLAGGALVVVIGVWLVRGGAGDGGGAARPPGEPPPGKVWSAEHGHWHDAKPAGGVDPRSLPGVPGAGADSLRLPGIPPDTAEPPGEPPPGKVWSAEHGHWHEDNTAHPGAPRPPGEAPPGKVWSEEHGHWHDASGPSAMDTLPPPAP